MALCITKADGRKIPVRTVRDLVENANPSLRFCLGASSSFIFIGSVAEFRRDVGLLEKTYSRGMNYGGSFMDRKICDYYKRDVPGEAEKCVILMEGDEHGLFWLRNEYVDFINRRHKR